MIKYLIWDFDGVICNSKAIAFRNHNKICEKYGLPKIKEDADYMQVINDKALNKYISKDSIAKYYEEHRNLMLEECEKYNVFDKVIKFIGNIKVESIIITATYEQIVKRVLRNNGYDYRKFKSIIGRETKGNKKDKITNLCKALNVDFSEIIYIGDTITDIEFCNELNIPVIAVGYGYCNPEVFNVEKTIKVCETEDMLIECIKSII